MESLSKESRIILALEALKNDQNLTLKAVAKIYDVSHTTLRHRRAGRTPRRDIQANSRKLTDLEELVIVQYILDLDLKGLPPRLSGVKDMADRLLAQRDVPRVGVNWAAKFVKRHPELTTRFNRKYDYQRALCEDPKVIRGWFALCAIQWPSTASPRLTCITSTRPGF